MPLFTLAATLRVYFLQAFSSVYGSEPWYVSVFFVLLGILILVFISKLAAGIEPTNHWQHHFDTLHYSSDQFYTALEQTIAQKKMPD